MCGIAGYYDLLEVLGPDEPLLEAMNAAQFHRGPDEGSVYVGDGVGLAHRRLAIIDLSSGQQPMFSSDGALCVVYNGEIYNFRELSEQLKALGHQFKTHCDTEVILYAWREWGESCVEHFRGMFAFALFDKDAGSVFLARDRLGVKPLHYVQLPSGRVLFSSELKGLLASSDVKRSLRPDAIADYFSLGYVPDPKTILSGVHKLAPGHTLTLKRNASAALSPDQYWDAPLGKSKVHESKPDPDVVETQLRTQLLEAVDVRLVSEVPIGAFLSGGVDSSAVVAAMAQLQDKPVHTCAIGFDDQRFDESAYASLIAKQYGTDHQLDVVGSDDFSLIDQLASAYDEPFADASALPTLRVCEAARKHVTVALSGDGGDEIFAGYRRQRMHMNEERVRQRLPANVRRPLFGALAALYPKLDWAPRWLRAKSTFESLARDSVSAYFNSVSISSQADLQRLFSQDFKNTLDDYSSVQQFHDFAQKLEDPDPLALIQYLDLKTWLPGDILTKVDRASMAHSLEVRVPLLDHRLIEWSCTVERGALIEAGEGKAVFKSAMKPWLPESVLYREKMGFSTPLAAWLRGPLRSEVQRSTHEGSLVELGLFDRDQLVSLYAEHSSGKRDHSRLLWSLMLFARSIEHLGVECLGEAI